MVETENTVGAVVSVVVLSVVVEDELSVEADEPPSSLPHEIMAVSYTHLRAHET